MMHWNQVWIFAVHISFIRMTNSLQRAQKRSRPCYSVWLSWNKWQYVDWSIAKDPSRDSSHSCRNYRKSIQRSLGKQRRKEGRGNRGSKYRAWYTSRYLHFPLRSFFLHCGYFFLPLRMAKYWLPLEWISSFCLMPMTCERSEIKPFGAREDKVKE